jgi:hypothetical protein
MAVSSLKIWLSEAHKNYRSPYIPQHGDAWTSSEIVPQTATSGEKTSV